MTVGHLVDRERARLRAAYVLAGVALAAATTCGLVSFGVLVLGRARWLALPRVLPFAVWVAVLAADTAVAWWTFTRLRRVAARGRVAAAIEREQALRAGSLRGILEVGDSGALGRHAADHMARRLEGAGRTLAPDVQRRARRRVLAGVLAAAGAGLLLGWLAPAFDDGLLALLLPVRAWRGTLLPKPEFRALPAQIVRGEPLELRIFAPRRTALRLERRSPGEAWKALDVSVNPADGIARAHLGAVTGDLLLVATDGRSSTDTAIVRVTDRPFVGAVSMRAVYPSYLGRAPEGLPVGEPARVPQGTRVEISGRASTLLSTIELRRDREIIALRADGRAFNGQVEARQSGRWTWAATGVNGPITDLPLPLELEVVPDSAPRVDVVSPSTDTIVAVDDQVPLQITASDDHGLASVDLESWRQSAAGQTQPAMVQRLASAQATVWSGTTNLDLAPRGLEAGDVLHLKVVAVDNSPWAQRGESRELLLKVPTMEERRTLARAAADSAVKAVTAAASAERSLEQRTSEMARERERSSSSRSASSSSASSGGAKDDAMSYENAQRSRAVAQDQKALLDRVKSLQQQAAQLAQQLRQAGAMDSSLARQLREAQAMLQQALTPDLLAQMQKLEDATRQLSGDDARQALKDLAAMQQRLREQLEKSAEMLKRAAYEGSMQTLHDEAKEIAQRERRLADSAAALPKDDQQAKARQLADRADRLTQDMKSLQERLQKDNAEPGAQRADAARKHAQASEEEMRAAADGARAGKQGSTGTRQDAAGSQSGRDGQQSEAGASGGMSSQAASAASQMEQAAQAMQDARDSQVQAWKKELTGELDRAVQELLEMSRQESALEQKVRSGQGSAAEVRGQQSAVHEGVQQTQQALQREAQKTSLLSSRSQHAMAEAGQKVGEATQSLSGQHGDADAANSLGEAADALNRAAASLARDREKANTASSASGFAEMLQEMQELAKRQGGINAQAQGLLPMPGGQPSAAMMATARALARQQRQIAQQLDDLGSNAGGDRAAQMAKEARQLADALEGGRVDASTLARQQQLFRRLLDAGRSLEKDEREDNGKREAQAATGAEALLPTNTNATGRAAQKFREPTWNELRGLTPDERRAILDYFKRINGEP